MKTAKGNTRRVFIFENIVIKVARIYLYNAIKGLILHPFNIIPLIYIKKYGLRWYIKRSKEIIKELKETRSGNSDYHTRVEKTRNLKSLTVKKYEVDGTRSKRLFAGIMANLQERKFYRKTKNIFVMPTYFSFFGLINIQKKGLLISDWDNGGVWSYLCLNSQNKHQPFCDGHTLENIENFCLDDGHLRIADYGSRHVEEFLILNGEKLYNNFKTLD